MYSVVAAVHLNQTSLEITNNNRSMTTFGNNLNKPSIMSNESLKGNDILQNINNKLCEMSLQLANIEDRLDKFDLTVNNELKEIKSSATCLLLEVRENAQIVSSLSDKGGSTSDITSQTSDSDSGIQTVEHLPESDSESALPDSKFAVLLSDTDMSELATKTSHLLNCQVDMVNYSEGLSDPTLFQRELQFVMIQGSGEILTKFNEVNKVIIEELTAHVQTLVKVAVNILEMQPRYQGVSWLPAPQVRWAGQQGSDQNLQQLIGD